MPGHDLDATGLGAALILLGLRYDPQAARAPATELSAFMRDRAYLASVELARERGAFPLFNAELYLSGGNFASRLPNEVKAEIRKHGLRNSHLLSIAPTGTISLAYRRDEINHPLNGFGVVIPRSENRSINAITWTSTKFDQRAPEGYALLRVFFFAPEE